MNQEGSTHGCRVGSGRRRAAAAWPWGAAVEQHGGGELGPPQGCSRVLHHQGSPAEVPLELQPGWSPLGMDQAPCKLRSAKVTVFFSPKSPPQDGLEGLGGVEMHRGRGFGVCLCLAGVSRGALGAAPALGGRSWHRSRLLRAEIPAGFILLWSHRVSAVDGDEPRADSTRRGQHQSPPPGPCPLRRALGLSGAAVWRSERDARGRWYPPGVVSRHPPGCRFLATKLLLGCLRGSGDGSSLGFWGLVSPGWLPCAVVWDLQLSASRCPPKHG